MPLGCSENQANLEEFITKAKAALVSVGIIRDPVMCKLFYKHFYCCKIKSMNFGKFYFVCFAIKILFSYYPKLVIVVRNFATFEPDMFSMFHTTVCNKTWY